MEGVSRSMRWSLGLVEVPSNTGRVRSAPVTPGPYNFGLISGRAFLRDWPDLAIDHFDSDGDLTPSGVCGVCSKTVSGVSSGPEVMVWWGGVVLGSLGLVELLDQCRTIRDPGECSPWWSNVPSCFLLLGSARLQSQSRRHLLDSLLGLLHNRIGG